MFGHADDFRTLALAIQEVAVMLGTSCEPMTVSNVLFLRDPSVCALAHR